MAQEEMSQKIALASSTTVISDLTKTTSTANSESVKEYNWMLLGVTGAGKSTLGNLLLNCYKEGRLSVTFQVARSSLKSQTKNASLGAVLVKDGDIEQKICIIDTPGLGDTQNIGKHKSKAVNIAEDASSLITELTSIIQRTRIEVSTFLVVIPLNAKEHSGTENLLDFLEILGDYWKHSIVVLTHGGELGSSESEQYDEFRCVLDDSDCPPIWQTLREKASDRFVIVESKVGPENKAEYERGVLQRLVTLTDDIRKQEGSFHDDLNSIGNDAFDKAKLELRHTFKDMESDKAQEAVYQNASKYVMEVVLKAVKIKLADGEDVDKLKEIAKLKAEEAERVHQQLEAEVKKLEEEKRQEQEVRKKAEQAQKDAQNREHHAIQQMKMAEQGQKQAEEHKHLEKKLRELAEEREKLAKEREKQAEEREKKEIEAARNARIEKNAAEKARKKAEEREKQANERKNQAEECQKKEKAARVNAEERERLGREKTNKKLEELDTQLKASVRNATLKEAEFNKWKTVMEQNNLTQQQTLEYFQQKYADADAETKELYTRINEIQRRNSNQRPEHNPNPCTCI